MNNDQLKTVLNFNTLIRNILDLGVEISMRSVPSSTVGETCVVYDLNTGMKSELKVWCDDGTARWKTRYRAGVLQITDNTESNMDLITNLVQECLEGRNFCSSEWVEAFNKLGYDLFSDSN